MTKTITQRILFKHVKAATLYDMYLNASSHSAITGGNTARISPKVGAAFSVYSGYISGRNLQLIKGRLIVQSWFGSDWDRDELDSTFILLFEQRSNDSVVTMTHANVPEKHVDGIRKGWTEYYWRPWKKYLASHK